MFDLSGKKALVTGASGGIGGAIAQQLAAQGAWVGISGTRKEALDGLAASMNGKAKVLVADLSQAEAASALIDEAEKAMEGLDILVCNAGLTRDNLSLRMKDEEWDQVIAVNLTSNFRLIRAAMKGMLKRRHGRIIGITSVVGSSGNPGQANYAASKAGLQGMVKSIAQEVAARGITANCVAPGFISTAMTEKLNAEQQEKIAKNIPTGTFGKPEDVAACVTFLASNEAGYVTGQTLHVNGGLLMV